MKKTLGEKLVGSAREAQIRELSNWRFEFINDEFFVIGAVNTSEPITILRLRDKFFVTTIKVSSSDWQKMLYTECGVDEFCSTLMTPGDFEANLLETSGQFSFISCE